MFLPSPTEVMAKDVAGSSYLAVAETRHCAQVVMHSFKSRTLTVLTIYPKPSGHVHVYVYSGTAHSPSFWHGYKSQGSAHRGERQYVIDDPMNEMTPRPVKDRRA